MHYQIEVLVVSQLWLQLLCKLHMYIRTFTSVFGVPESVSSLAAGLASLFLVSVHVQGGDLVVCWALCVVPCIMRCIYMSRYTCITCKHAYVHLCE